MELSSGKLRGIRRLADPAGRFKMVAVDQRPPMLKALADRLGGRKPGYEDLGIAKAALTESLLPFGSALLIDPDYGFPIAEPVIPPDRGLLVTLENFNFEETPGGRKTRLMDGWSVAKAKRMGADGVKLLLWYRPDADPEVVAHQKALVRAVGEDARRFDIPFLLELLVYPFKGSEGHTTDYTEDRTKRPELVLQSLRDFAGPEYGVDIYKLESPGPAVELPDPDGHGADVEAAQAAFDAIPGIIDRPWVMLSAGASMEVFHRVLIYAFRAGANGYLAGRAIWWPAFQRYPDVGAMKADLESQSSAYMADINALTDSMARRWVDARAFSGEVRLADAGHGFPSDYLGFY